MMTPSWKANVLSGRSPYGERGLKYDSQQWLGIGIGVALLTESVD